MHVSSESPNNPMRVVPISQIVPISQMRKLRCKVLKVPVRLASYKLVNDKPWDSDAGRLTSEPMLLVLFR